MAYLFKLSSRLIVERHLPTIASDAYGIGFVEETRTTRTKYCRCIATVSDRTHWARNFVCFSPLDCCLCSPCLLYKAKIGFGFLLLFSFTSLLTPHRTLVNTHKINKCAKFGSSLLGVSREDDENIVSYRVSIKCWPSQVVILKFVNGLKTIKTC